MEDYAQKQKQAQTPAHETAPAPQGTPETPKGEAKSAASDRLKNSPT
jgi:hypothetical protein